MVAVMMLIIGFGVNAAIVPLHTWLPDAHSAAPSGISAILSGIVIQAGFIALFKCLLAFGNSGISIGVLLIGFALITMTLGNMLAFAQAYIRQGDLKRVLAYSSIAQMGYIILGIGLWMQYGTEMGLQGGLFHIMTHAFMKGLAFLCAGLIIYRWGLGNFPR
jgi:formate hydrogenlyase subunit 3/multisubunit Na+/H+ antiporter MnhD subunit